VLGVQIPDVTERMVVLSYAGQSGPAADLMMALGT
jgi:hypothetical protein